MCEFKFSVSDLHLHAFLLGFCPLNYFMISGGTAFGWIIELPSRYGTNDADGSRRGSLEGLLGFGHNLQHQSIRYPRWSGHQDHGVFQGLPVELLVVPQSGEYIASAAACVASHPLYPVRQMRRGLSERRHPVAG